MIGYYLFWGVGDGWEGVGVGVNGLDQPVWWRVTPFFCMKILLSCSVLADQICQKPLWPPHNAAVYWLVQDCVTETYADVQKQGWYFDHESKCTGLQITIWKILCNTWYTEIKMCQTVRSRQTWPKPSPNSWSTQLSPGTRTKPGAKTMFRCKFYRILKSLHRSYYKYLFFPLSFLRAVLISFTLACRQRMAKSKTDNSAINQ